MKKRAIIVVIDSMGIGAMPDCREFGDQARQCPHVADKGTQKGIWPYGDLSGIAHS